ncbi:MAG: hypothetical protein JNL04_09610 [Rhodospirillaceae bacterium]|nr:hypothetical protein [Rhodospirillaceae bacterium]
MTWHICAIGRFEGDLPERDGVAWQANDPYDCDAVVVGADVGSSEWLSTARALPPLVPVGVIGPLPSHLPADFVVPSLAPPAIEEMLGVFQPIRDRIDELPGNLRRRNADLDKLAILGLAYSRARPIEAERGSAIPSTVSYPLLRGRPGLDTLDARTDLEALANLDLLDRRFFARVLTCPGCASGRLAAFEACIQCGSANLFEEPIIHHYRCGFQDGESRFVQGSDLVCPKCKHELKHFGVDYGRPGTLVRCRACQQVMTEPQPAFRCLDCQATVKGEQVQPFDWHHYDLNDRGAAATRVADLPHTEVPTVADAFPRTYALKDFLLLIREQSLVAERYKRPMAIGSITVANLDEMRAALGAAGAGEIMRLFVQIVVESMRETDLATLVSDDRLVVAMPETGGAGAKLVLESIRVVTRASLSYPLTLEIEVAEGAAATALLESLTS